MLGQVTDLTLNMAANDLGDVGAAWVWVSLAGMPGLTALTLNLASNRMGDVPGERALVLAVTRH